MGTRQNIITIGREHGSGGWEIAQYISHILKTPFYDKEIIRLTAEQTGLTEEMIQGTEESEAGRRFFSWFPVNGMASAYDQAIVAQAHAIRTLARKGPCVMVGRGADYILRDFPNVVNVFIHGDWEEKLRYLMEYYREDRETALHRMKHTDAARKSYYHYLTKGKWGNLKNYHLTIHSGIGKEACGEIVVAYAMKKN